MRGARGMHESDMVRITLGRLKPATAAAAVVVVVEGVPWPIFLLLLVLVLVLVLFVSLLLSPTLMGCEATRDRRSSIKGQGGMLSTTVCCGGGSPSRRSREGTAGECARFIFCFWVGLMEQRWWCVIYTGEFSGSVER